MARTTRKKSQTAIYHIMLRGINQQQIFIEDEDYYKFLRVLKDCKEICGFELYAYCLMGNHVHLLIKEGKETIDNILKRVGSRFVYWYNIKYDRKGHLFQDRFRSEPVDDQSYFNTVLVYIHQNPKNGGICKDLGDYKFSSYNEYINKSYITDTEFVLSYWDVETFKEYNQLPLKHRCLDISEISAARVTDEQAVKIIKRVTKCENPSEFQKIDEDKKRKYLKTLNSKGISIRQLNRLTGIPKGIIERAVK